MLKYNRKYGFKNSLSRWKGELLILYTKGIRLLSMFEKLLNGQVIDKQQWMNQLEMNERTFERDIQTIREFLDDYSESHHRRSLEYDYVNKKYKLDRPLELKFQGKQALSLSKILLESRAFNKEEMNNLIGLILNQVDEKDQSFIKKLIQNELYHFVPLKHNKQLFDILWDFSLAIESCKNVQLVYRKANGERVNRLVNPIGIMFSEFYFYVLCDFPKRPSTKAISYRLDRIESYEILTEVFNRPYAERFQEGEFRKKIHSMYQGNLIDFSFEFKGHSIEAVLDRFPLARIKEENGDVYVVEAKAYEEGLIMWILSQGDWVKVLSPPHLIEKTKSKIEEMKLLYQ